MRFLKSILIISFIVLAVNFAPVARAAGGAGTLYGLEGAAGAAQYTSAGESPQTVADLVQTSVSAILGLLAIVFFGLLTYAGVRWMTARGNEEFVTSARTTLETAITGLIIILSAYAITTFIFGRLQGGSGLPPAPPPSTPTGCAGFTSEENCPTPACRWSRASSECVDAVSDGSVASCSGATQASECPTGCTWTGSSCLATVSDTTGACLRVIQGQLYCESKTRSGCTARGAGYSFYAGEDEAYCAAQGSFKPFSAITPCVEKGGQCIGDVVNCRGRSSGNANDCGGGQVCCLP